MRFPPEGGRPAIIPIGGRPPLTQVFEVRQRDGTARLVEHGELSVGRPEHQGGAAVAALKGGALITGRLMKMLLVGLHVVESVRRTNFARLEREVTYPHRLAIRPTPFRQVLEPFDDLADLQLRLPTPATAPRSVISSVFG